MQLSKTPLVRAALFTTIPAILIHCTLPLTTPHLKLLQLNPTLALAPFFAAFFVSPIVTPSPQNLLPRHIAASILTFCAALFTSAQLTDLSPYPTLTATATLGFFAAATLSIHTLLTPTPPPKTSHTTFFQNTLAHAHTIHTSLLQSLQTLQPHDTQPLQQLALDQLHIIKTLSRNAQELDQLRFAPNTITQHQLSSLSTHRERLHARALRSITLLEHLHHALLTREATHTTLSAFELPTRSEDIFSQN